MEEEEERGKKEYLILGIRIVVSLTLALLGRFLWKEDVVTLWGNVAIMAVAWLIISYDIVIKAIKNIFKEHVFFDENILMILASIGAFALRAFGENEFLEAVLVILLYQVGEVLEDLAADKSKEAILKAIDLREEKARVYVDGNSVWKKPEELQIGDVVIFGAGEKILCDGVVIEGEASVDESSLTGESLPIQKKNGADVYAGTLLKEGSLHVQVSKEYADSTVAKLMEMIENGVEKKSKAVRFITRFSRVYTPIVFCLALLIAALPPLIIGLSQGNLGEASLWGNWVHSSLSFLVVSCPCAIVISVPLAYFAGLGLASKHGILVKGAGYFDHLNRLKVIAFDKTGTLTDSSLELRQIESVSSMKEEEILAYAAALEAYSSHPIALAIRQAYGKKINEEAIKDYQEIPGVGVKAIYEGRALSLSSRGEGEGGIWVSLKIDNQIAGHLCLSIAPRQEAKQVVASLKEKEIHPVILSGDSQSNVTSLAKEIGIEEALGGLSPKQKQEILSSKLGNGSIAYVGDGINDAPSLALADVGIAMGGLGSDLAIANADVVLMNDDLNKVVEVIDIAKKTRDRARFNVILSLIVKGSIMVAAVVASIMGSWSLPLWVSVIGDSGLALLTVLFSLLLGIGSNPKRK